MRIGPVVGRVAWSVAVIALASLVACGDDGNGGSGTVACDDGFVAVGGECRPVQDGNNGGTNNGEANNGGLDDREPEDPAPYTCDYFGGEGFAPAAGDMCDLVAQDCPDGMGCLITVEGAACLDAGTVGCGDPCNAATDCQPGLLCAGDPSRCLVPCEPGTACPGDSLCAPVNGRPDLGVCSWRDAWRTCDVFEESCGAGEGCYLINDFLVCAPTGHEPGGEGESCSFANGCEPGLLCGGSGASAVCRRPCEVGGAACPNDEACTPLRGLDPLGLCY